MEVRPTENTFRENMREMLMVVPLEGPYSVLHAFVRRRQNLRERGPRRGGARGEGTSPRRNLDPFEFFSFP